MLQREEKKIKLYTKGKKKRKKEQKEMAKKIKIRKDLEEVRHLKEGVCGDVFCP